jgi:hypothetical protein
MTLPLSLRAPVLKFIQDQEKELTSTKEMKGLSQQDGKYMRSLRVKSLIAKSPLTW